MFTTPRRIAIWRAHKQERKLERLKENVDDDENDDDDLEWGSAKSSKTPSRESSSAAATPGAPQTRKTLSNSMIKYRPASGPSTQVTPATPSMNP